MGDASGPGEDGPTAMPPTRSGTHVSWLRSGEPWAANVMTAHAVAPQSMSPAAVVNVDVTSRVVEKLPSAASSSLDR